MMIFLYNYPMLGAIIGDIAGSVYEFCNIKTKDFNLFSEDCFFTDDTVLTCAVARACLCCHGNYKNLGHEAKEKLVEFGKCYPPNGKIGYGQKFLDWLENPVPQNSWGNGAAMRVSPVAYFASSEEEVIKFSNAVTEISHNHKEALKGASATALCVYLALKGQSKEKIKNRIERDFYSLNFDYDDLVKNYTYHVGCKNTVPQAIYCFLISNSFEDAIKTAVSIGGDSDTLAAITGAIAEAFYGVPKNIENAAKKFLDENLIETLHQFKQSKFNHFSSEKQKNA